MPLNFIGVKHLKLEQDRPATIGRDARHMLGVAHSVNTLAKVCESTLPSSNVEYA